MPRHNLGLEVLSLLLVIAAGVASFIVIPLPWLMAVPVAFFAGYVVLETLLPKVWETPPRGIRYEPGEDE